MAEKVSEAPVDPLPPAFRMNPAVVRILLVCAAALVLPLALAVTGFTGIWKGTSKAADQAETVEPPGLRQTLEVIANGTLPEPTIDGGIRRFVFEKSEGFEKTVEEIQLLISRTRATAMQADESSSRWIVQVPAGEAPVFDTVLSSLRPAQLPSYPIQDRSDQVVFYEINLSRVP